MKVFRSATILILSAVVVFSSSAQAATDTIQFPEDELAAESVLPVFDHPVSVKNKSIRLEKRFEFGPLAGLSLLEPFYNPMSFGASLSYNLKEDQAINLLGLYFMQGLSSNGNALNPIPGSPGPTYANLQYAPAPKYLLLPEFQYSMFYGKLSLGKNYIMNLNLFGLAGLGAMGIGDEVDPTFDLGLGQKFYFSPNFALRFDLRLLLYYGPNVLSKSLSAATSEVSAKNFEHKLNYSTLLSFAAVFLFPGM